jgi:DNA/RNA endonuclease G (NUC1)
MFSRTNFFFLLFLSAADICLWSERSVAEIIIGDMPLDQNPNAKLGLPRSFSDSHVIISRPQYVISWNIDRRVPEWVSWLLLEGNFGESVRTNVFHLDHELDAVLKDQNRKSVSPSEYRNTCLDRGHQVPSADRTSTDPDNQSTFLMSNVAPQSAFLNRRTWVSLERFVRRRIVVRNESAQIYTGSIYSDASDTIGPNKDIHVPRSNFKIVVLHQSSRFSNGEAGGKYFVVNFANVTSQGTSPVTDQNQACTDAAHTPRLNDSDSQALWRPYLSSLDQIEVASGMSFDFLRLVHQLSAAEVDELLAEDLNSMDLEDPFTGQTFGVQLHRIFPWQPRL